MSFRHCRPLTAPLALAALLLAGCADRIVQLRYEPDDRIERLAAAQGVTVFRFADSRGSEGDKDPLRVGGIYLTYGNRVARVMTPDPWPVTLVRALTEGFKARGVQAVGVPDQTLESADVELSTPFALGGEIKNFSTESRFTKSAHVSGVVRLYSRDGRLAVQRPISVRASHFEPGTAVFATAEPLEGLINEALRDFVRRVVQDPEITRRLAAAR